MHLLLPQHTLHLLSAIAVQLPALYHEYKQRHPVCYSNTSCPAIRADLPAALAAR